MAAALVGVVVVGVLLRTWDLGHGHLSIDESYSALASRMSLGDIVGHIDRTDPHPPLSYLIAHPMAALTTETAWLRMGSAAASCGALAVLAWWQRRRGIAGLTATAVFALSAYQLGYGREMRMYGFLCLGGVVTAWAGERWIEEGRPRWVATAAIAATSCAFLHATGAILLLGLLALPLLRRDRAAWSMRAAALAGITLFAVLWGAHALSWGGRTSAYPTASLPWLAVVVNETVAAAPANRWIVLTLLVVGAVVIVRRRDAGSQVWLLLALAPVVLLFLASLRQGVLIPKSLMAYSWGSALALGAAVGAAWRRALPAGLAVAALLALLVVPYTHLGVHEDEGAGGLVAALDARVEAGDAIGVVSARRDIRDLIQWYRSAVPGVEVVFDDTSVEGLRQVRVETEPPSGRLWLVTSGPPMEVAGHEPCGAVDDVGGSYHVQCLVPTP